jgi:hypothetical protein
MVASRDLKILFPAKRTSFGWLLFNEVEAHPVCVERNSLAHQHRILDSVVWGAGDNDSARTPSALVENSTSGSIFRHLLPPLPLLLGPSLQSLLHLADFVGVEFFPAEEAFK